MAYNTLSWLINLKISSCHFHNHHQTSLMTDYLCNYTCVVHYRQVINFMKWCWHNTQFSRFVDLDVIKSDYNELLNSTFCPIQEYAVEYL